MIAVLQKMGTHHRLGHVQIAIHEQPGCGHDIGRYGPQGCHMTGRPGGVVGLRRHAIEPFEHVPAGRQRVIMFTADKNASIAGGACFITTKQCPRSS